MTETLRIGWTRAQAAERRRLYRRLLGLNLLLLTAIGLLLVLFPISASQLLGLPAPVPTGWVRVCGGLSIVLVALYLPGWAEPLHVRWPNLAGIAARLALAVLYALIGSGFLWLALFELVFAALLGWSYGRYLKAELMSRP